MKKTLLGVTIAAAVLAIILISLKAYYVLIALLVGGILIGYRELWSLIKNGYLPPFDERVRVNTVKAIRNAFVFYNILTIFLMLLFSVNRSWQPEILHVLGSLFIASSVAYILSYLFYDRADPNLTNKKIKMLKIFLITAGSSVPVFIISILLHNAISGLLDLEEAIFFTIAVIVSPLALLAGIIGSFTIFIMGLAGGKKE